ncbi:MAG: tetratricopeptide repeat protein [Chitinophagaceae bacterium]|nr:MAG: tetratricopeptide repeat protein [Chitinophagaceae bacterium]
MKKPILLAAIGLALTAGIFLFGKTSIPPKPLPASEQVAATQQFNIEQFIDSATTQLTPAQVLYVTELENGITRGDVPTQQKQAFSALANFWKDSAKLFEPYAYYISEQAKLDNSEKNLTFAAQLFLENLRAEHDAAKLNWKSTAAIELFERAIKLNPNNDDLRIGLGSCYVFGKGRSGDAQQTMKGIQELLVVARKDSSNMKAQFVLGVGGFVSGQYDKAIERFHKVVEAQPGNLEAVAFLADTYAAKGNKAEAVKWYNVSKRLVNDPAYNKQVDDRIAAIK